MSWCCWASRALHCCMLEKRGGSKIWQAVLLRFLNSRAFRLPPMHGVLLTGEVRQRALWFLGKCCSESCAFSSVNYRWGC